ncbi:hypothetical protein AOLI_G00135160 [Acnodon oligacanthus]
MGFIFDHPHDSAWQGTVSAPLVWRESEVGRGGLRARGIWATARRQTGLTVICWVVVQRQRLDNTLSSHAQRPSQMAPSLLHSSQKEEVVACSQEVLSVIIHPHVLKSRTRVQICSHSTPATCVIVICS